MCALLGLSLPRGKRDAIIGDGLHRNTQTRRTLAKALGYLGVFEIAHLLDLENLRICEPVNLRTCEYSGHQRRGQQLPVP
jgi:hypothetical protein